MTLRDFLETRERELMEQIATLQDELAPKERELAEIRRVKAALALPSQTSEPQVEEREAALRNTLTLKAQLGARAMGFSSGGGTLTLNRPYDKLTMKQLVVKVLQEHFPQGATTREMLDFFRDGWGRHIERTNLSPQISRLFQEGIIGRNSDRRWFLLDRDKAAESAAEPP